MARRSGNSSRLNISVIAFLSGLTVLQAIVFIILLIRYVNIRRREKQRNSHLVTLESLGLAPRPIIAPPRSIRTQAEINREYAARGTNENIEIGLMSLQAGLSQPAPALNTQKPLPTTPSPIPTAADVRSGTVPLVRSGLPPQRFTQRPPPPLPITETLNSPALPLRNVSDQPILRFNTARAMISARQVSERNATVASSPQASVTDASVSNTSITGKSVVAAASSTSTFSKSVADISVAEASIYNGSIFNVSATNSSGSDTLLHGAYTNYRAGEIGPINLMYRDPFTVSENEEVGTASPASSTPTSASPVLSVKHSSIDLVAFMLSEDTAKLIDGLAEEIKVLKGLWGIG
ncbi:hypothetical protein GQ43DRAFT_475954 [Delitschia confertaspora ATCC 74209]|uniref:Uncharacterized protein n=1 Tax=Delitschia confertaspora ATCC 74209 TaxID=1513339 RepID=A0A9P4JI04_9PLEO|nr:hypothetical protein GQ43DRAFT_475954 [Delitschia confertaspora ATCC 74209]